MQDGVKQALLELERGLLMTTAARYELYEFFTAQCQATFEVSYCDFKDIDLDYSLPFLS
jgi:hypothetical protein